MIKRKPFPKPYNHKKNCFVNNIFKILNVFVKLFSVVMICRLVIKNNF